MAIVSLNYDNIAYRCLPDPMTGFDSTGKFQEGLIFNRPSWPCFLHLHGSVHFDMRIAGIDLHETHWQEDLSAMFGQNAFGRNPIFTGEGITYPQSAVIAGLGKTIQILRRPFRTYYSELDRLIYGSDALLCLGYSFRDPHLNEAIKSYRDNRRRPVVLIDFARDDQLTARTADWDRQPKTVLRAMKILETDMGSMQAFGSEVPDSVEELKALKEFDVSVNLNTRLAIWYSGMAEACKHPAKVLQHLSRPHASAD